MLEPVKMSFFNNQQMARVFDNNAPLAFDVNWISSGRQKSLADPAIQITIGGHPDGAVRIRNYVSDIEVGNSLLGSIPLKA